MNTDYNVVFNLDDCMKKLGLNEQGRVQQYLTSEIIKLSDPYIPLDEGNLKSSVRVEGTDVVWGGSAAPYAHYQWGGIVYEDPLLHCAGFQVADGGWRSRKNVQKVPTDRKLQYQNGKLRGPKWVPRMLQNGGMEKLEAGARRMVGQ